MTVFTHIQNEYEMRLLILCDEGSGDEIEIQHILSQPEVNPNVYDEVKVTIQATYTRVHGNLNLYFLVWQTSLWHASYNGKVELVRILLENGADVNLPTDVRCFKSLAIPIPH